MYPTKKCVTIQPESYTVRVLVNNNPTSQVRRRSVVITMAELKIADFP